MLVLIRHPYLALWLLLLWSLPLQAQQKYSSTSKKAISLYEKGYEKLKNRDFEGGVEDMLKAVARDPLFVEAHFGLARNFQIYGSKYYPDFAARMRYHFEQVAKLAPQDKQYAMAHYVLANEYLKRGQYPQAQKAAQQYLATEPGNADYQARAKLVLESTVFALKGLQKPLDFRPEPLPEKINKKDFLVYFPVLTADQNTLIYTARHNSRQSRENMYISRRDSDGQWQEPTTLSERINTPSNNEGTCSISADGRMLVFTSCQSGKTFGSCDLFISRKIGDEWTEPVNLGPAINSPAWESQPSLSADGRTLYFVSDRNRGRGKDIYVSYMDDQGQWQEALNLGESINSAGDEFSPFIHANGKTLFFSSNGRVGYGGLDIYYSDLADGQWTAPTNLGYPINNHFDQVSLFISSDGKKGYYSDEKLKENGIDYLSSALMYFDMPAEATVKYKSNYVKGTVYDAKTKKKIKADIELFNINNNQREAAVQSDPVNGSYMIVLAEGAEYALEASKKGYTFKSAYFNYSIQQGDALQPVLLDIYLDPIEKGVKFTLNNIFFDTGEYRLKDKSKAELDKLIQFMLDNELVRGEISGHTDNIGDAQANVELSLKRAKSVYEYLQSNGIATNRLIFKGYGQSQPAAPNDSEENRQRNRRIEFKIL
mgnify:FL=1